MQRLKTVSHFLVATVILVQAVFLFGPLIETKWFQPTRNPKVTSVGTDGKYAVISVTFTKVRDCPRVTTSTFVRRGDTEIGTEPLVKDAQGNLIPVSAIRRPVGVNLGETFYISMIGDSYRHETLFNCHPFWPTRNILYDTAEVK